MMLEDYISKNYIFSLESSTDDRFISHNKVFLMFLKRSSVPYLALVFLLPVGAHLPFGFISSFSLWCWSSLISEVNMSSWGTLLLRGAALEQYKLRWRVANWAPGSHGGWRLSVWWPDLFLHRLVSGHTQCVGHDNYVWIMEKRLLLNN